MVVPRRDSRSLLASRGWSVSSTNDTRLAQEALRRALIARRPELGLLHHTDRGSPYASLAYTAILRQYGVVASRSRAGDCSDGAVVEKAQSAAFAA